MAEFTWEARARTGEVRKGTMEADDELAVQARLRQQQLSPVKVKRRSKRLNLDLQFGSGVTTKDLVTFTRLFATMIDAGLPIVQCLDILANQQTNKQLKAILKDIKFQVEQGSTFSDALRRHPRVFDDLFVNLVQAGEVGGILDSILNRLAVYIEKRQKLIRQVRGALTYPAIVIVIAAAVMAILMTFVIPAFETMFKDFGGGREALPAITRFMMGLSSAFVTYLPLIVLGLIGSVAGFIYAYKQPRGKRFFHQLLLRLPIMGNVMSKIAVARFTRTLGTLLQSGVPILDALEICARTSGNVIVEEGVMSVRTAVSEGQNMAEPLMRAQVFPEMVVQMISVGEQTGALDQMLNKIADFYEEETDVAVAALTSSLEPIMMVGVGGMVGVVLVAMYLPIFSLAGNIKG
ncbi:MAG: type II secretion system F family protein [Myxococcales bacterium]|jgi:type IV pilus assembly protein PilC|nr:type II secretion system F family protein [Myxococcales bacterium]